MFRYIYIYLVSNCFWIINWIRHTRNLHQHLNQINFGLIPFYLSKIVNPLQIIVNIQVESVKAIKCAVSFLLVAEFFTSDKVNDKVII